jgi:MFS family permease
MGMSLWFTASAVSPQRARLWSLSPGQTGWLTTLVQLGFVAGTGVAAFLNLADLVPARSYLAVSALLGGAVNAAVAFAPGYAAALVFRFLTGFFLAGVYPPAMKMAATWFRSARGLAIGAIVGALTVGKATPYLVHAFEGADYRAVILVASGGALAAALLVGAAYRDGPFPFERRPFQWSLVGTVLRHRESRLAIFGYLGHMWELYAMWSTVPLFFYAYFHRPGAGDARATELAALVGFVVIGMGGIGAVLAGNWADRWGRERVTIAAMAVSGTCALITGWLGDAPAAVVVAIAAVWGFTVVADSAQFSAVVTEVTPRHAVGTGLTIQTSLGFALTAASIALTIAVSSRWGWGPAFALLAIGPAFGIAAMLQLGRVRREAAATAVRNGA